MLDETLRKQITLVLECTDLVKLIKGDRNGR